MDINVIKMVVMCVAAAWMLAMGAALTVTHGGFAGYLLYKITPTVLGVALAAMALN